MSGRLVLKLLDQCSAPAADTDEDGWGHAGSWAWVLDGATPTAAELAGATGSPAAALVQALGAALHLGAQNGASDPVQLTAAAISRATRTRAAEERPAPRRASACLGLVQLIDPGDGPLLRYLVLGDVTIVVSRPRSLTVVDDPFAVSRESDYLQAASGNSERFQAILREHRRMMNADGGYWIVADDPAAADHAVRGGIEVSVGDTVLLASDGLARAVDLLGRYPSWRQLVAHARAVGLAGVVSQLRTAERTDPQRTGWARAKVHDDATGVLLVVAQEEQVSG